MINLLTPRNTRRRRAICRLVQPGIEFLEARLALTTFVGPIDEAGVLDVAPVAVAVGSGSPIAAAEANVAAESFAYDSEFHTYEDGAHEGLHDGTHEGYPVINNADLMESLDLVFHDPQKETAEESQVVVNQVAAPSVDEPLFAVNPEGDADASRENSVNNQFARPDEREAQSQNLEFPADVDSEDDAKTTEDSVNAESQMRTAENSGTQTDDVADVEQPSAEIEVQASRGADGAVDQKNDRTSKDVGASESAAIDQFFSLETDSAVVGMPAETSRVAVAVEENRTMMFAGATAAVAFGYEFASGKLRGSARRRSGGE